MTVVAIGAPYATRAQLKNVMGIPDSNTSQDTQLDSKLASATLDINRYCHRQFGRDEVSSPRTYEVGRTGVSVDDIWDRTDIAAVPYLNLVASTPIVVASQVVLEPRNGVVDGVPGWPVTRLAYLYYNGFLTTWWGHCTTWVVTAKWGWEAVPDNVVTACLLLASSDMAAKNAPFGVAAFGDYAVRLRQNPMAAEKLEPYRKEQLLVAS